MAQVVTGIVGGVVGFFVGGPAGAAIGFGIGMAVGAPAMQIPGAKLGEIAKQTSKEGGPRLIVWGIVRPIGGNLIATSGPNLVTRKIKSGKGGGGGRSPRVTTIFRTYAIGICEGPITDIRRVWRNNKLVYDNRFASAWGNENNNVFLEKARFYYGDYDQLPAPELEFIFGVGNVPAMRGTAYMAMLSEDVTDMNGAIPQYTFEVIRAEGYSLTSKPYPAQVIESADSVAAGIVSGEFRAPNVGTEQTEAADSTGAGMVSGEFRALLFTTNQTESADSTGAGVVSGEFRALLFSTEQTESADSTGAGIVSGEFREQRIPYENYPAESADSTGAGIIGGVHETA